MNSDDQLLNSKLGLLDAKFLQESVEEIMSPAPFSMSGNDSIAVALDQMVELGIGAIVIVNDKDELAGIFTERDVLMKVVTTRLDLKGTPVSAVMTRNPHAEPISATIAMALHCMAKGGYRHLPIVDDSKHPIGMVSVKDIMDRISTELLKGLVSSTFSGTRS